MAQLAVLLTQGASLLINGMTGDSITTDGSADGIRTAEGAGALAAQSVMIRADGTGAGIQNDANNTNITLRDVTIDSNDGPDPHQRGADHERWAGQYPQRQR